jgi:hypothetical protein
MRLGNEEVRDRLIERRGSGRNCGRPHQGVAPTPRPLRRPYGSGAGSPAQPLKREWDRRTGIDRPAEIIPPPALVSRRGDADVATLDTLVNHAASVT